MFPSAEDLVAKFLRTNGYTETLASFLKEACLPPDAGSASSSQITLEKVLQEKKTYDLSLNFEKLGVDDKDRAWLNPAPAAPSIVDTLPSRSNILSVSVQDLCVPSAPGPSSYVAVTTADRKLHLLNPDGLSPQLVRSYDIFDSPVLDVAVINARYLVAASMSGKSILYDTATEKALDERKDHSKYVVKLASWSKDSSVLLASAGWDARVCLYRLAMDDERGPRLGAPIATTTLASIPEVILFTPSPTSLQPMLLLTRRDSSFLHYYTLPAPESPDSEIAYLGKQNLAPHSNAWVAFTPSDVQICPADPSIAAVATSSTPHMKLIIVRLLVPPEEASAAEAMGGVGSEPALTQASQARAELLVQDREEAAMLVNISTMAPQTDYSTPKLTWRPDGSGVYVSSDDGIIRGFEASTGKLASSLEAHEAGTKLRCLWAGRINEDTSNQHPQTERLISGGFDQRLIVWSPA